MKQDEEYDLKFLRAPGPLEGLSLEERLVKYSVILRFTEEDEIDTKPFAEEWAVQRMGVASMMQAAKNSKNLHLYMIAAGYQDDEFPVWWYSPASEQHSLEKPDTALPSVDKLSTALPSGDKCVFKAHPPQTPALGAGCPGRPAKQDRAC